jgi:hypothetical protein
MGLLRRRLVHNFDKFTILRITSEIQILSHNVSRAWLYLLASGVMTVQSDIKQTKQVMYA